METENNETAYDAEENEVKVFLKKIKEADEKTLKLDILPAIRKRNLSRLNREKLVKPIQERFKELTGASMPISDIRASIAAKEAPAEVSESNSVLRERAGIFAIYLVVLFINAFVDLGHKIIIQNTIFMIYGEQTQLILTAYSERYDSCSFYPPIYSFWPSF